MAEPTIAEGLMAVANAIKNLGNGNAATPLGGLEAHGLALKETGDRLAEAFDGIAQSINEVSMSLDSVAAAIRETKE